MSIRSRLALIVLIASATIQSARGEDKSIAGQPSGPRLVSGSSKAESLRGYVELNYRSKVDGTKQPFTLGIPNHYEAKHPWAIQVALHGFGGTHYKGLLGKPCHHDYFKLYVHGRARGVGFFGLSEIDVLEAMEVVAKHWKIDPDRVHLMGGSMGGFGTLRMGARFPDRFASLRVLAGSGLGRPLENLLLLPTRALHGDADHSVPICLGRGSIRAINEFGGKALIDEFPGLGHSIPSAQRRPAAEWAFTHKLIRAPKHIHYTATDELARGAYWVKVVEWGRRGMPANIDARVESKNSMRILLDNVTTARIELGLAPVDMDKSLKITVNSDPPVVLNGPLPAVLWISTIHPDASGSKRGPTADYHISTTAPTLAGQRLHYPGGSFALYHGEPLLIVYGTQSKESEALRKIAEIASRSADGKWPQPAEDPTRPTVFQMTTGRLPIRADKHVTSKDLEDYNLVLLGDAQQNSVVRRLADQLPVTLANGKILTSDGNSWDFTDRGLGLLHSNPLAESRLIYWIAADNTDFYQPGTIHPLSNMMDYQGSIEGPADFMIMDTSQIKLVAARRFDSRWNWIADYKSSPVLTTSIATGGSEALEIAEAIRKYTKADYGATTGRDWYSFTFNSVKGVTRKQDVAALYYGERIGLLELTGEQLLAAEAAFGERESKPGKSTSEWFQMSRFVPPLDKREIDPKRKYRIAFPEWAVFTFGRYSGVPTDSLRLTNRYVRDAIEKHLKW